MLTREKMKGVYAIMPTAFKKNGDLDEENYRGNVRILCDLGFHGIFNLGTTGEFYNVGLEDYKSIVNMFVDEIKSNVVSIIGASAVNTEEAIIRTKYAQDCGVDAVMNVVPFYVPPMQSEIIQYFQDLGNACPDIGILAYDNPYTTKVSLNDETYRELVKIPNFCGAKHISPDIWNYVDLISDTDIQLFPSEEKIIPAMLYGIRGFFASAYFLTPKMCLELYEACRDKNWDKAIEIEYKLRVPFKHPRAPRKVFDGKYAHIPIFKALVNATGLIYVGYPRKPHIPVSEKDQQTIKEILLEISPYYVVQ